MATGRVFHEFDGVAGFTVLPAQGFLFRIAKRICDIVVSLLLLPVLLVAAIALTLANPFLNRGRLIYAQHRMGQGCRTFTALKFRTMRDNADVIRPVDAPLEHDRITRLGKIMRQMRIDELPQIINVLRGEMSLIGPRPDCMDHARHFLTVVPGYKERHSVRPGISGFAQTEVGYVEGTQATRAKVVADLYYINNASFG